MSHIYAAGRKFFRKKFDSTRDMALFSTSWNGRDRVRIEHPYALRLISTKEKILTKEKNVSE